LRCKLIPRIKSFSMSVLIHIHILADGKNFPTIILLQKVYTSRWVWNNRYVIPEPTYFVVLHLTLYVSDCIQQKQNGLWSSWWKFCFLVVQEFELRSLHLLSRHSIIWALTQLFMFGILSAIFIVFQFIIFICR
jgi:hypothetical protein